MRRMYSTLIDATQLAALIGRATPEGDVLVLDCRHELSKPDWGDQAYTEGHIPGAIRAHLDRDDRSDLTGLRETSGNRGGSQIAGGCRAPDNWSAR